MCTAFQQKEEKGIRIGEERGERRVNHLLQLLLQDGRVDDIGRMATDRAYQEQLFQEYGI